jgi:hypothetical protein
MRSRASNISRADDVFASRPDLHMDYLERTRDSRNAHLDECLIDRNV